MSEVSTRLTGWRCSDGKIVTVGVADLDDIAVVRFNSDGTLDAGFGGDGTVTTDVSGVDWGLAVALQPDGKIVAAGLADNGATSTVVRYNSDGSLDAGFDGDGRVLTNRGSGNDEAQAVAVQTDGKIVTAGFVGSDSAVIRYNTDGSLDANFGSSGAVITDFGSGDQAYGVVLQPDGRIVTSGYANNRSDSLKAVP